MHVYTSTDTQTCIVSMQTSNQKCKSCLNSPFVTVRIKIQAWDNHKVNHVWVPMVYKGGTTQTFFYQIRVCVQEMSSSFDRWGEFFITKIEHTHGTSTLVAQFGCASEVVIGENTKNISDLVAAHNIMTHLRLFMLNFILFTCTNHVFVFTPCFVFLRHQAF